jgi:hypothetical protein
MYQMRIALISQCDASMMRRICAIQCGSRAAFARPPNQHRRHASSAAHHSALAAEWFACLSSTTCRVAQASNHGLWLAGLLQVHIDAQPAELVTTVYACFLLPVSAQSAQPQMAEKSCAFAEKGNSAAEAPAGNAKTKIADLTWRHLP